jgi:hypothetical protein
MASNVIDRETVQVDLAAKLATKFGTTWDVFDYKTATFAGKARNIVVAAAGSKREIKGAGAAESDSSFRFRVFVFVLYQDPANAWTAKLSETELNGAEKKVADFLNDTQTATYWDRIYYEGETDPDMVVDEGGQTFRREIITIRTEKYT